jgi:hypothetical protein
MVDAVANINPGQSFLYLNNQSNAEQLNFLETVKNTLAVPQRTTCTEISASEYVVQVNNASAPFFLVLSNSYNGYWVANINGQQKSETNHFMVNGYANAWYINKTGTFSVKLEFWPQNLLYISAAITIASLIVLCVNYLFRNRIKIIYQKRVKKSNQV